MALNVAEEYVERDLLRMYEKKYVYRRMMGWQIFMIFAALVIHYSGLDFSGGKYSYEQDTCRAEFS